MKNLFQLESNLFKSLANPKRLEILHLLQHQPVTVGEIVHMSGIPQATVSQHLMVLRKLRLVKVENHAQEHHYSLSSPEVLSACSAVRELLFSHFGVGEDEAINRLHLHKDPICGMVIAVQDAASSLVFERERFYFCALGCEKKFKKQKQITQNQAAVINLLTQQKGRNV